MKIDLHCRNELHNSMIKMNLELQAIFLQRTCRFLYYSPVEAVIRRVIIAYNQHLIENCESRVKAYDEEDGYVHLQVILSESCAQNHNNQYNI